MCLKFSRRSLNYCYYYYYYCLFSQPFSFWYFYFCTKSGTHRSGLKFQTAVLSVLRAIFQVQLSIYFCFFLRYWYLSDEVFHAASFVMFRSMIGALCMILSTSFGCWSVPNVWSSFPLLMSKSGKHVVMLVSLSISHFIIMCT